MIKKRLLTYKGDFVMGGMWEKDEVVRLLKGVPGTQYQEADDNGAWYLGCVAFYHGSHGAL